MKSSSSVEVTLLISLNKCSVFAAQGVSSLPILETLRADWERITGQPYFNPAATFGIATLFGSQVKKKVNRCSAIEYFQWHRLPDSCGGTVLSLKNHLCFLGGASVRMPGVQEKIQTIFYALHSPPDSFGHSTIPLHVLRQTIPSEIRYEEAHLHPHGSV